MLQFSSAAIEHRCLPLTRLHRLAPLAFDNTMTGSIRKRRHRRRFLLAPPGLPGHVWVESCSNRDSSQLSRYTTFMQDRALPTMACVRSRAMDLKNQKMVLKRLEDRDSKSACLSVCLAVQNRLPRELRDMIFGYLLLEDGVHARLFHYYNTLDPKAPRHYWNKEFTGDATLRELTQSWYRSVRFDFDRSLDFLPHLLAQTDCTLQCTRQELIGKASFKILQCDLDRWPAADANGIPSPQSLLLKNMECLFSLRHGASIYIILESPLPWFSESKNLQERQAQFLTRVLDIIFPTLRRLRRAGYSLAISIDPGSNVRFQDGQQIWRYELKNLITPINAHFSCEGFVERFLKDDSRQLRHRSPSRATG
ncbi:hypothetical protein OPT61_g981 [Boeremia exigua]|uniref:Uncharacterized protein n=1 Tax=Boeremia exigua TaxID=749465 RepID=A0ACC2IRU9_9PLEO|nr:hypothetical protein OPT61_g981 [Boeremia exigua]